MGFYSTTVRPVIQSFYQALLLRTAGVALVYRLLLLSISVTVLISSTMALFEVTAMAGVVVRAQVLSSECHPLPSVCGR